MNGNEPSDEWASFITSLDRMGLERAFLICRDRLSREIKFPPSLGEFMVLINARTQPEVEQAFARWTAKAPQGRAEQWVFDRCTWNLKRARSGYELVEFSKYIKQADELERNGNLVLPEDDLLALPVNSAVSLTDKKREEFTRSGKKSRFSDRINKLVKTHRPESS
ncbi:MAG: hypothetical protein ACPHZ7_11300 [Vibrio toranzoniae]|jgi:hypothetical protein